MSTIKLKIPNNILYFGGSPCSLMDKVLDCSLEIQENMEFKLTSK